MQQGATSEINVDSGEPLYLQVARILKDEIVGGVYPVGSLLPTEDGLRERFSVSRYTVREALRLLRDDGLVMSRRGAGTIVVPPSSADSDSHRVMSINDLLTFAADTRLEIESISMVKLDSKQAARAGLREGEDWLEVRGYRYTDDEEDPVCWTQYFINRQFAAVGRLLQRQTGSIFTLIEDLFGRNIVEVQQQIAATLVTEKQARGLHVDPGTAALEVRRSFKTAEDLVAQVTINIHPASRFQHSMTMRRMKA